METDKDATATNTVQPTVKRTASFVSLTLKDVPNAYHDPSVSTISGTVVAQTPIFKTLNQRRLQRMYRRNHQQQQQPTPQQHTKLTSRVEIEQISSTPPPMVTMPNLMELAMRSSPLPNIAGSIDSGKRVQDAVERNGWNLSCILEPSNRYAFETHTDTNGINHHRLYNLSENLFRPFSKNEAPIIRTNPPVGIKMPSISNNHDGSYRRSPSCRAHIVGAQQILPSIETVLKERSIVIAHENLPQVDAMDRVHQILKQLYVPSDKKWKHQ